MGEGCDLTQVPPGSLWLRIGADRGSRETGRKRTQEKRVDKTKVGTWREGERVHFASSVYRTFLWGLEVGVTGGVVAIPLWNPQGCCGDGMS